MAGEQGDRKGLPYMLGMKCRGDPCGLPAICLPALPCPPLPVLPSSLLPFLQVYCLPLAAVIGGIGDLPRVPRLLAGLPAAQRVEQHVAL